MDRGRTGGSEFMQSGGEDGVSLGQCSSEVWPRYTLVSIQQEVGMAWTDSRLLVAFISSLSAEI